VNRSRLIREFELKKLKNKTVQPDTVKISGLERVWQKKILYILRPFTPINQKL